MSPFEGSSWISEPVLSKPKSIAPPPVEPSLVGAFDLAFALSPNIKPPLSLTLLKSSTSLRFKDSLELTLKLGISS